MNSINNNIYIPAISGGNATELCGQYQDYLNAAFEIYTSTPSTKLWLPGGDHDIEGELNHRAGLHLMSLGVSVQDIITLENSGLINPLSSIEEIQQFWMNESFRFAAHYQYMNILLAKSQRPRYEMHVRGLGLNRINYIELADKSTYYHMLDANRANDSIATLLARIDPTWSSIPGIILRGLVRNVRDPKKAGVKQNIQIAQNHVKEMHKTRKSLQRVDGGAYL